jgi:acetolactate synthase-1/2/3 large subunit
MEMMCRIFTALSRPAGVKRQAGNVGLEQRLLQCTTFSSTLGSMAAPMRYWMASDQRLDVPGKRARHAAPMMEPNTQASLANAHPLAGTRMSGADTIVQVLADEGVETIFGYSGGAILPTYDAVFRYNERHKTNGREPMPLIVPANEQGAGFMASGYARATGRVGVAIVTSGPGATNCVTSVRDCMADSIPIVVICGQVATGAIGSDAFQEAPVSALMGSVAKHVFLVTDPVRLESTMRSAFEIARTGRPGPVVIDVPKDVQNWTGPFQGEGLLSMPGYHHRLELMRRNVLDDARCAEFFDFLKQSRRPLIYAGGGVINGEASGLVRQLASTYKIPVAATLMGLGGFDTTDPLSLHMLGMHGTAYANYAVDDCDLLIAIGARFDDRVAGDPPKFAPRATRVLHFDIDPSEINKVKPADWYHVGRLRDALEALLSYGRRQAIAIEHEGWISEIAELKKTYALNYDRASSLIQPQYVIETINEITRGEAIITTGVGQHQMWAAQYFDFREPRLWITSGSMGTMGFGLPAAIGAQFAQPGKLVIDLDGDASIRMNLGELETVTTYNLPVKVVILNNFGDGMVMQWQRMFFKGRLSGSDKSLRKKDFVKAAQADGFQYAQRLDRKADVPRVIAEFLAFEGPAFLEVIIDPEASVYPMVPPGLSYRDMVTGDFIPSRYDGDRDTQPGSSEMF